MRYDIVVIGAGQGGGPLAGAFARAGKRVALVERAHVGGTCINEGCSPTKTMVASARVAHLSRRAVEYGVHHGPTSVDLARVRERKSAIVASFRQGSERALERAGAELIRGQARFVGERMIEVSDPNGTRTLAADIIVINTGLRPSIPPVPGLDDVPYLTSTSIMELEAIPTHLIVLGGGYVGLEFAQMFRRFGSNVTVLQRGEQLLRREDRDVADEVAAILGRENVNIVLDADVLAASATQNEVRVDHRRRPAASAASSNAPPPSVVSGSHLLIAAGREPNTDDLELAAAGVETDERGYVRVSERLETTAAGVYAIGDVKGGPAFTHISYDDFRVLRTNLLGNGGATTAGRLLPYTVFIDPQLGRVGMSEKEARAAGKSVRIAKLPMSAVARAFEVDETQGFIKAVVDAESDEILGASVLGLEGGELAALFQIAMMGGLHYSALRDGVFSHPTLAEALNNLFTAMDRAT
jgi:pyruvate/2-oxoglutarate dehydrogenase complex dihydrolipoamide dehydrogenase (E3) component